MIQSVLPSLLQLAEILEKEQQEREELEQIRAELLWEEQVEADRKKEEVSAGAPWPSMTLPNPFHLSQKKGGGGTISEMLPKGPSHDSSCIAALARVFGSGGPAAPRELPSSH